jgi:hypothetical protein
MKQILFLGLLILSTTFQACRETNKESAAIANDQTEQFNTDGEQPVADTAGTGLPAPQPGAEPTNQKQQQPKNGTVVQPGWDKKIIRTAAITAQVQDFKKFAVFLKEKVKLQGGYVSSEEQNQAGDRLSNTVVIKIPVDRFDEALRLLEQEVGVTDEKRITAEDVTKEFVDTRSRLETKRQMRLRYLELLKQAKNMEEILQVQTEINRLQEEIESVTARINYLTTASAMSTIHLTYYQVIPGGVVDHSPGFWQRIAEAFYSGWEGVRSFLVAMVHLWPLFVLSGVLALVIGKWKSSKRRQTPLSAGH